jgi:hypothetical protein
LSSATSRPEASRSRTACRPGNGPSRAARNCSVRAGSQAKAGIGLWITFSNHRRPHTTHGGQPPALVCFNSIETDQQVQAVA